MLCKEIDFLFRHLWRAYQQFRDVKEDESSGPKGIPFGNPWVDDKAILANPSKRALQPSGTPEKKRPRISRM